MNLGEALKISRGVRPIRRKSSPRIVGSSGDGWVDPHYLVTEMGVDLEDLEADDWEIKEGEET